MTRAAAREAIAAAPVFDRIAVVGLGLLGGSVALAARARGAARHVVGSTRGPEARARALETGAVDALCDLAEVARGAQLVVLATPIHAMQGVLEALRPGLEEGAIVTDVGSVKGRLDEVLPGCLPPGAVYLGSHPMAGSHERGMTSARADLFEGAPCVVSSGGSVSDGSPSPRSQQAPPALERLAAFWRALGAHVVIRDAAVHDEEVAWTSHLPHLLAFAFGDALAGAPEGAREVVGSGFRDFTRIAHSDPELWADILTANRKALAAPLQAFQASLAEIARAVEAGDAEAAFERLARARRSLFHATPGGVVKRNRSSSEEERHKQGDRSTPHE